MQIITLDQAKKAPYKGLSIALGAFDGLHIGHMALIEAVTQGKGKSAVLTFDTLPGEYFRAEKRPAHLFTSEEKQRAFEAAGIDVYCVAHFDTHFAQMSSSNFENMLYDIFAPSLVVAGYNFTYGRGAQGNAQSLKAAGANYGFDVRIIAPILSDGEPVSASRIRVCIEAGDVSQTAMLLGRPYEVFGTVISGRQIGSTKLGYPTANLHVPEEKLIPLGGVYGVETQIEGQIYKGVCNIGTNPTVSQSGQKSIEIHILSLSQNLYGKCISVRFIKRLRGEKKFDSVEQLKEQIKHDIERLL